MITKKELQNKRLESEYEYFLSSVLMSYCQDNFLNFVSISKVMLSRDHGFIDVYIFCPKKHEKNTMEKLNHAKKHIRYQLTTFLKTTRNVPNIRFFYDNSMDVYEEIQDLIEKAK